MFNKLKWILYMYVFNVCMYVLVYVFPNLESISKSYFVFKLKLMY